MSPVGVFAFGVLLYAALALPRPSWRLLRWILLALVVGLALAVATTALRPPTGLKASYWASATSDGPPERSTDFLWLTDATRIEPTLSLSGEEFGVHFFNDAARFNFGPDVQPGRDQLPFSVRWDGWLLVPSDGQRHFVLQANGPAHLFLDGQPVADDPAVNLTQGLHPLRLDYVRPEARVPQLQLTWQRTPGGPLETVGGDDLRYQSNSDSTSAADAVSLLAEVFLAAAIVTWLALGVWQLKKQPTAANLARAGLGLVPLLLLGYGMLLEAPAFGRTTILSGLDDWLVYESSARDILLHGPLMDGGQGRAAPFYGQPLYPYVLAVMHWLSGESLAGPVSLQFAALGLVVVGTAWLAQRAFGAVLDGLVAAAALLVLLQIEPEHFKIARQLFNENLYMPLVMASLIVLVGLARRSRPPTWWQALLAGVLLGLTAISRAQFLLCVPFGLLIAWLAWRRTPLRALAMVLVIAGGLTLAILPVTARNWIVSGQLVPISSSAGASLLEFHRPPPGLIDPATLEHDPLYDALHLDQPTRTVVAFIRADPLGYLRTLLPLGAHSLGLQGRNDPGIYWPLFITVLTYAISFGLQRTRQLHVWPIHAFVGTHLLVLMLFEADTYGYRLVMPMYAPMVAVAAQVPLEVVRRVLRSRAGASLRSGDQPRAARFAAAGWAALIVAALVWQAHTLVDLWPVREPALHGLGGAAANAALTSDQVGATAIYVASVDGTPRRFGAGSLPGLRYPWFKWFDPTRSVPLASGSDTAVYMLAELADHRPYGDLTQCLGTPDADGDVVIGGDAARQACAGGLSSSSTPVATFDGVARIDALQAPASAAAGDTLEARLLWQPLVPHPDPYQLSLQLDDPTSGDGTLWGNGTLDLYPSVEWQTDESVVSRVPVSTDPTAIPQAYRLTIGMRPERQNAPPALATWQGTRTDRVPVSTVSLTPGSAAEGAALPADMQSLEGPPLVAGGLELIGARPLPAEAAIGSPLRIGLLWRATQDAPSAQRFRLRLVGASGEVVQDSMLPLLGGRVPPSTLHAGNVVRDEQNVVIDPAAPSEPVSLELAMDDASLRLGTLTLTGRAHTFDTSGAAALATFGSAMDLLAADVSPSGARGGDKVTVQLKWRAAASMPQAYKVFVHVLDPSGQQVVAQRDAEPKDAAAPTTGWVTGEVIDNDAYAMALPAGLAPGAYPVEIGVYDARSGARLTLADGSNRYLLASPLMVK